MPRSPHAGTHVLQHGRHAARARQMRDREAAASEHAQVPAAVHARGSISQDATVTERLLQRQLRSWARPGAVHQREAQRVAGDTLAPADLRPSGGRRATGLRCRQRQRCVHGSPQRVVSERSGPRAAYSRSSEQLRQRSRVRRSGGHDSDQQLAWQGSPRRRRLRQRLLVAGRRHRSVCHRFGACMRREGAGYAHPRRREMTRAWR